MSNKIRLPRIFSVAVLIPLSLLYLSEARAQSGEPSTTLDKSAVKRVEPVYPPLAKAARISGNVVVEVSVDEGGNVASARAISGHPLLRSAAEEAARGWKWGPTTRNGVTIKVKGTITFTFQPEAETSPDDETDYEEAIEAYSQSLKSTLV